MLTANAATGVSHDCFCYNDAGLVWNGSAYVAWVDANYAAYRVAATERGTSGTFTATEPAGTMRWEMRVRAGTLAGSYVVWAEDLLLAAFKADADLGTASGGMVAEVLKIPRAAAAVTAGAATTRNKVSATSTALVESIS